MCALPSARRLCSILGDPGSFLPCCPQHRAFVLEGTGWLRAAKSQEWHLTLLCYLSGHHLHLGLPQPSMVVAQVSFSLLSPSHTSHKASQPLSGLGLGVDSLPKEWTGARILCSRCQVAPSNQSPLPALCCNQLADSVLAESDRDQEPGTEPT